jgi:hypothetical protein
MAFIDLMDVDNASDDSNLTTLESGDIPTLPCDEAPPIQALYAAIDDARYDLAHASIPRDNRVKIKGIHFVKYDPYRSKRSRRSVWYWDKKQAEELIRVTKGQ